MPQLFLIPTINVLEVHDAIMRDWLSGLEDTARLPLNILFYGINLRSRDQLIPVYEKAFNIVEEFTLHIARAVNEIMNLRERPKHLWHSSLNATRVGISYEETEKFYDELLSRLKRLLKYKVREYFVKILWEQARAYVESYEEFLDHKIIEDENKFSNIADGLKILELQSEISGIVLLCEPGDYTAILEFLKNNMDHRFSIAQISLIRLFEKMRPFIQKNRIMQNNYEIALNILEREKPKRFTNKL